MKTKQMAKIFCDVAMTVSFLLLVVGAGNVAFHEVLGIAVAILFVLHLALNSQWIKKMLTKGPSSNKDKMLLTLDLLLLLGIIVITATGIMISQVLFSFNISNLSVVSTIHHISSYITLGVMATHIGFHVKYLVAMTKKTGKNIVSKNGIKVLSSTLGLLAVFALVYTQAYSAYVGSASTDSTASSVYQTEQETTTEEFTSSLNQNNSSDSPSTTTSSSETTTTDNKKQSTTTTAATPAQTLSDYLGKLYCNGCGRHCCLLSPQCNRGEQQAQTAEQEYDAEYATE